MLKKTSLFLSFCLLIFSLISCSKSGDNEITITFVSPTSEEAVANKSSVLVHISFEATDENHEVKVVLHPEGDSATKIINWKQHSHRKKVEFKQTVDLSSFPSGTRFHLEAIACLDEDCTQEIEEDIYFIIQ
jgi:hypothetical protein